MRKKCSNILAILTPNKKINLFVISIIFLGVISGTIFFTTLSDVDKETVITQMQTFFQNTKDNKLDNVQAFKNGLISNYLLVFTIWILGLSIIGTLFNVFLIFIKSFMIGFSLGSILFIYKAKGIIASFIYLFPTQLIFLFVYYLLGIYSLIITFSLIKQIFSSKNINFRKIIKKYLFILLVGIILILFASFCESFVFPALLKLVIKLFV